MRIILGFVFFVFSINVISQEYFSERFGFGISEGSDNGYNTIEIEGGYIISGGTTGFVNQNLFRFGISKFSLNGEFLWNKSWGDDNSIWYSATFGSLISKSNVYYTINTKRASNLRESKLVKYNSDFDTICTISYKKSEYPFDSTHIARSLTTTENGFAIVGTLEILHDLQGNYKQSNSEKTKIMLTPEKRDKWYSTHEIFILEIDSMGNVLWEKYFPDSTFHGSAYKVSRTTDGGYAIGAYKHIIGSYGAAIGDPIVIKTDSLGNKEWELNLGGPYQDGTAIVCNSEDSSIIVASRYDVDSVYWNKYLSRIQLTKIDLQGNIIWNKLIGEIELWSGPTNIRQDSSGGYIISGKTGETNYPVEPNEMGFALRVNADGDSLWYRKYAVLWNKNSFNYLYDMIPTSNGGFLGAGGCVPGGSDTGNQDAWIIKVDSMGCTSLTDCWVGEPEWEWITTESGIRIKVFPNPAHNWFEVEIKTENKKDENLTIEVFDLYGRLTEEVVIPKGQNSTRLYVSDWNRGVYLVRVKDKNCLVGSGKVIVK